MRYRFLSIIAFIIVLTACSGSKKENETKTVLTDDSVEVIMPEVPENITDPKERADYLAIHFWDNLDFKDTVKTHNSAFIEQNFSNYVAILGLTSGSTVNIDGFSQLMKKAGTDRKAYDLILEISEKYLYDPNSPMLSEALYIDFLQSLMKSNYLNADEKEKYSYQLTQAMKNRPGMQATDFTYTTLDGKKKTLRESLPQNELMLIFFDPECEHCDEILGKLMENPRLTEDVQTGKISVLAVYAGENRDAWKKKGATLPKSWSVGINQNINDDELYYLPAMPTIYILDKNGVVIEKDLQI